MERNIKRMSENYLELTNQAVESKRGGNVEKYKSIYEEVARTYRYIDATITSLNNKQFVSNSRSYGSMMSALQTIEQLNIVTLIIIGLANLSFVVLIASTIAKPLVELASIGLRLLAMRVTRLISIFI